MRQISFKGKTAYITEAEHKGLLKRFDLNNPKGIVQGDERTLVRRNCVLCVNSKGLCTSCPLKLFDPLGNYGCVALLNKIIGYKWKSRIGNDSYQWKNKDAKLACSQITKIYEAIKGLPRVERRKVLRNE